MNTCEAKRQEVLARLRILRIPRRALANEVEARGHCAAVTVMQWLGGQTRNPGLKTWLGVVSVLRLDEVFRDGEDVSVASLPQ